MRVSGWGTANMKSRLIRDDFSVVAVRSEESVPQHFPEDSKTGAMTQGE